MIVLLEGDLSAIEHVKLAVENNIPVVVIEGTGGAADLLAEFMYTLFILNVSPYPNYFHGSYSHLNLTQHLALLFRIFNSDSFA